MPATDPTVFRLTPATATDGLPDLLAFLRTTGAGAATVDAGLERGHGALLGQLLAAARRDLGEGLVIQNPSDGFLRALERLGLTEAVTGAAR